VITKQCSLYSMQWLSMLTTYHTSLGKIMEDRMVVGEVESCLAHDTFLSFPPVPSVSKEMLEE
jgi:hypothetical protein